MAKITNFDAIKRIFPREGVNRRAFSGDELHDGHQRDRKLRAAGAA